MAAFVGKIRDFFSDIWLQVELHRSGNHEAKPAKAVGHAVTEADKKAAKLPFGLKMLRLSKKERLFFFDQMATLIESGVTLIDSLSLIKAQTTRKSVQNLYGEMIHYINTGMSLAEAMRVFPFIFPPMHAALVEAGEKSGNLKGVLAEIVVEMEENQDFYRKITGAMFYPVILIILALTMVTGMMVFVIPKISKLYAQSNVDLPAFTQTVINLSNFVSTRWQLLFIGVVGVILLLYLLVRHTRLGKLGWESFVSAIPVFGKISREKNLMIISSNLGMLLSSGVLISDAFEITEKTVPNLHYRKALASVRHGIVMGAGVSEMMKKDKLFPLQMSQLMHIGEATGTIAKMLFKIRDNLKKSVDYKLKNISTMIEPLMIFIVAALVGSILLAVMLPFFYIGTTIH